MQTTQNISLDQLDLILESVFADGNPVVKEAYSEFDAPTKTFSDADTLRNDMSFSPGQKKTFFYSIYYPEAKGTVTEKRIELKPGSVGSYTHRYCQEGWGLIDLQCDFRNFPRIECRVVVNSASRANNWSDVIPEMKAADLWDWKVVNRHAGRLVRLLRKLAKETEN